jgi:ligand-binding sensor domain-containing protein/signal transduction histidine kinase
MNRIISTILLTGAILVSLWSCQPNPREDSERTAIRRDSVLSPVLVKAGIPEKQYLENLSPPKKTEMHKSRPPVKKPADFFIHMKNFDTEDGLAMSSILCGFRDQSGIFWFGTSGNGVSRFDGKSFTNFNSSNGLIHNLINCITEDSQGNIWFGTLGGISVYDGRSFVNYTTQQGLPDNDVNKILEDRDGNIWIGTQNGLSLLPVSGSDESDRNFINFDQENGLEGNAVYDILEDKNGGMWLAAENGVHYYDAGKTKAFVNVFEMSGLKGRTAKTLAEDHDGIMWFGTDNGIIRFDPSGKSETVIFSTDDGLVNNNVRSSLVDTHGNIWFGTYGGASVYSKTEASFINLTTERGLSNNIVCSITEDEGGSLWFGTLGGGLCRYDGQSILGYTAKQGLPGTVIYAVTEDHQGNLWLGSNDAGITKFTLEKNITKSSFFTNYTSSQGLPAEYILALMADRNGDLWIGSPNGMYKFDGQSFFTYTTEQGIKVDYTACFEEDRHGHLWIGTYQGGASRFDGKSFANYTTDEGLVHNTVWAIMEDSEGFLWFATRGGLSIFTGKKFINFTTDQGLPDNKLSSLLEDRHGNILIGSWGGGISIIRKEIAETLISQNPLKSGVEIFENYSTSDGLSNNVVYNILEDSAGNIFIGSNEGITVLKGGLDLSGKSLANNGLENYNQKAGFPIKDISNNNSMFIDSRGILWGGTGDKLVRFDYSKIHKSPEAPRVYLRSVKINNEHISWHTLQTNRKKTEPTASFSNFVPANQNDELLVFGKILNNNERDTLTGQFRPLRFDSISPFYAVPLNLSLPYAFNQIGFDFVGVETRRPFLVRYQYKLEGYDNNWSAPDTKTTAEYGNLPAGDYTFLVKAKSPDGVWSEPVAYRFKVLPPWYLSWPAYMFYGLLLFFVIYLADRVQRRRLIAKERHRAMQRELEQAKEIEKSYHELKVAQNQLIQSERMASLGELAAGIAHEIQNPLNFVNNFSEVSADLIREMNEEMQKGNTDEVMAITADLTQNLEIISQHGKRASSIVKGMLEHSRTSKGEKRSVDINALADEFLRLSFHGLRAKDKSFNADFKTDFDPNLPKVEVIPQDIGRVLLNLINNAFYACAERSRSAVHEKTLTGFRTLSGLEENYKPTVTVSTKNLGNRIEISVMDNGNGIPEEIKNKIFQPFFTTKPTGQGTGLGLSLSYDIIAKGHGGELLMETKPGGGTVFIIQIPIK